MRGPRAGHSPHGARRGAPRWTCKRDDIHAAASSTLATTNHPSRGKKRTTQSSARKPREKNKRFPPPLFLSLTMAASQGGTSMDPPSRRPPRGKVRRLGRLGNLNAGEKKTHHDLLRRPAKKAKMTVSFRYGRSDGRQLENGASRGLRFHDRAPALPSTRPPSGPYEDQPYDRYVGRRPHATGECPASHPRRADAARTVAAATVANPERGGGSDAGRSDRSDGAGATLCAGWRGGRYVRESEDVRATVLPW